MGVPYGGISSGSALRAKMEIVVRNLEIIDHQPLLGAKLTSIWYLLGWCMQGDPLE